MTISSQSRIAGPYMGTGAVSTYSFSFKVFQASDLMVVETSSGGVASHLVLNSDYSVTLNPDQNATPGGTVTLASALGVGESLVITSELEVVQNASLSNQGAYYPRVIEDALDRLTILMQEARFVTGPMTLRVPTGETVPEIPDRSARANTLLAFDSNGDPTVIVPVSGSAADVLIQLASTDDGSGSDLVGFKYTATGAAARTLADRQEDWISIFDFCTQAEATTNVYPAFTSAVTALALMGGGTLYMPPNDYRFNTTGLVTSSNIVLRGAGSSTRILNGQTNAPAIQIGNSAVPGVVTCYRNGVHDMIFGSASGVVGASGQSGLYCQGAGSLYVSGVEVYQFPAQLYDGIVLENCFVVNFDYVQIQNCLNTGLTFKNNCGDIYGASIRSDANVVDGFRFQNSNGIYFTNCTAFGNQRYGWLFAENGTAPTDNNNFFFTNCVGDTSGNINWNIAQMRRGLFTNCWGSTQLSNATNTSATGFSISGGASGTKHLEFVNCRAVYNNGSGFLVATVTTTPFDVRFVNCTAGDQANPNGQGGAAAGFYLSGASEVKMLGCSATYNIGSGITVVAGVTGSATDCTLTNNTVAAVSNSAPTTFRTRGCKGYQPATTNVTAGTSPWTSTALPYDSLFSTTLVGGMTLLSKNGDGYSSWAISPTLTYQAVMLKAGETITATWVTTAPQFSFGPCQ